MDGIFHPWNLTGTILNSLEFVKLLVATCSFLVVGINLVIRQPPSPNRVRCEMLPRKVYNMCQGQTVTSELALDPSQCPQKVFHKLFQSHHASRTYDGAEESDVDKALEWETLNELQKARACGNFGSVETSDLFLKVNQFATFTL